MEDLVEPTIKRRNQVTAWLEEVISASRSVPVSRVKYRGFEFEDPAKWVVIFLGTYRGLFNLEALEIGTELKTNILVVCMTNEPISAEQLEYIKKLIGLTHQGGILIVRWDYTETIDDIQLENRVNWAIDKVQSTIDLYPSKNVPII